MVKKRIAVAERYRFSRNCAFVRQTFRSARRTVGAAGTKRAAFIRSHAYAVSRAIAEGVPVRGYFFWSFVDNFEWTDGFAPRFGLYHVDYTTLDRHLAAGAEELIELAPQ